MNCFEEDAFGEAGDRYDYNNDTWLSRKPELNRFGGEGNPLRRRMKLAHKGA